LQAAQKDPEARRAKNRRAEAYLQYVAARRLSATTDRVKTLEMCFDSAQHERFRIVISSTYPFALSAVEGLRNSFHTI
jgi:hypothetical protein